MNNIVLTCAAATVLLGTMFPLLLDALDLGMISVGPPYFNMLFVPQAMLLALALGFGILLNWKQNKSAWLIQQVRWILVVSVVGGLLFSAFYGDRFIPIEALAMGLVFWMLLIIGKDILNKTRNAGLLKGLKKLKPAYWGMQTAHLGLAVTFIGVAISSGYSIQRDVRMEPGDVVSIGEYSFRFDDVVAKRGPNYISDYGTVSVFRDGRKITTMHPEKRLYTVQNMPMTEAAIDPGLSRDLYVALGEKLDDNDSWAIRLHVKPFVRWIWLGSIFMLVGGLIAISDRRYRLKVVRKVTARNRKNSDLETQEEVLGGQA